MADPVSYGNPDRDIEQALIALKKGTQLIKYSRKGKPKFCPFRVSPDETTLIWYSHGSERILKLSTVQRIIPGQRTPVFRRFLRPEKEYLSFSLIYNNGERSLDLICKDKAEAEVWIAGLKALTSTSHARGRRTRSDIPDLHEAGSDPIPNGRPFGTTLEFTTSIPRGRASVDLVSREPSLNFPGSDVGSESANMQGRSSGGDGFRISVSSTPSCSSGGSGPDDIESLGDVYVWGEIWSDGVSTDRYGNPVPIKNDVLTPKSLESNVVLDVQQIACGHRHVALVTRQGEVFTWGEESGGRLGHGIEKDFSRPRLVEYLAVTNVDFVACGEHHTCAVSTSGDLYSWGDGTHNAGLLGHGNDISHWIPTRISGPLEGLQVLSVACGIWHSALATSSGKLFTFGDGSFGVLGHGDRKSVTCPKEVQLLSGLKTIKVACGAWHTAAIVEVTNQSGTTVSSKKLFTWGDGDKYRLGHGNKETYLLPTCVSALIDYNFHQIACGNNTTIALTTSGHVFTMGSNACGQLGNPQSDGKSPCLVQDRLVGEFVEEIASGAFHVAVLTSRSEVFTWGKGANGRLGHGDIEDRDVPTFVEALKDRHVKNIACGSNYTASICIHKWVSGADQSLCSGCRQAFGFTRKRHNCYNCGLVHCHACSSKKAMKAALAPTPGKPHRVCDACYMKLKKAAEANNSSTFGRNATASHRPVESSARLDRREPRTSRILLSPTMEPVKYLEVRSGKLGTQPDYSIVRESQVPSLLQLKDIAFPSSLSALQYALKPVTTAPQTPPPSQPASNSRPASPYSRRPSPPRSVTPVFSRGVIDGLKKTNEFLNQEVSKLQKQIKSLKEESQLQEQEVQKLKNKAQEAASLAVERSSKCTVAVKTMKLIANQLKEVTERLPSDILEMETFTSIHSQVESFLEMIGPHEPDEESSLQPHTVHDQHSQPDQTLSANESAERPDRSMEDNVHSPGLQDMQQNAEATPRERRPSISHIREGSVQASAEGGLGSPKAAREVIEQFEPGVYVTLIQLSNGTKIFKRVKFSKRRFMEQQAEEWWKTNKDRLLRKYSTPKVNSTSPESSGTPEASEEKSEAAQSS
ncbi:PH, RCC1 and FYVE domains-containing protein 1 isoform X1 [Coffea eugenioides]|uniref:PH, RCC1 and FYVE domains-containing protein 1 isoform X1 n=1 Tax=Coffea eugenioides TaxID=49369 RepID=UPI000F607201|nr:PH, RCC1 and FYVE domains-containing protein 1 isoform X1 [Coffea eugenioides]